jgi:hypothetical protein
MSRDMSLRTLPRDGTGHLSSLREVSICPGLSLASVSLMSRPDSGQLNKEIEAAPSRFRECTCSERFA